MWQCGEPRHVRVRASHVSAAVSQHKAVCLKACCAQHHHLAAWHACSHTCHFPELIQSGPCRAVCKSAEFQNYHLAAWHACLYCALSQCQHVVQQACPMHSCHVPVLSCGGKGSPIVTCCAPASCRRNIGITICTPTVPVHMPVMSQNCHGAA